MRCGKLPVGPAKADESREPPSISRLGVFHYFHRRSPQSHVEPLNQFRVEAHRVYGLNAANTETETKNEGPMGDSEKTSAFGTG
jgi:hypothetical protein